MTQTIQNLQNVDSDGGDSYWHELPQPWQWCIEEAWTSYCKGSLPIGAVITDEHGKLLARGRNRIYEDDIYGDGTEDQILHGHRLAHAEMNALIKVDWKTVNPHTCILYTTTEPCPLCVGAVRLTRICTVYYASRDQGAGSADLFTANPFMRRGGIQVTGPQPEYAAMETILVAMLVEVTLRKDEKNMSLLYESVAAEHPAGAALGKYLFQHGLLNSWKENSLSTEYIFDHLISLLRESATQKCIV